MQNDIVRLLNDTVANYLTTHAKLKVGKINSIDGDYATIEFFERSVVNDEVLEVPIIQKVPLLQSLFSFNANGGVVVPYAENDNVLVGILDNLNKQAFFGENNVFENLFPHNMANAVVIGKVNTEQQEAPTTEGVLMYKETSSVEVLEGGVKIAKGDETLQKVLKDISTNLKSVAEALSSATTTVASFGTPTPLDNAGDFSTLVSEVAGNITRLENLLK